MTKRKFTASDAAIAKRAINLGYYQHDIAAYFKINQGRISELNTGKLAPYVAPSETLPPDFPPLA